jgi:hypothetical protein
VPDSRSLQIKREFNSAYVLSKPKRIRFNLDAITYEDAVDYFRSRATQGLSSGLALVSVQKIDDWGALATWQTDSSDDKLFYSVYILANERGKGRFTQWLKKHKDFPILTTPDCNIEAYLNKKKHPYIAPVPINLSFIEYDLVNKCYSDHCANRTGIHFINHIDEGLWILQQIKASQLAMRAYILHPLIQGDSEFLEFFRKMCDPNDDLHQIIDSRVLALAIEYRSVANEYLSQKPSGIIRLSPLKDVNDMLIADKIQNRKDFELFHEEHHERNDRLSEYFKEWLSALGVSEELYQQVKKELVVRVFGKSQRESIDSFDFAINEAKMAILAYKQKLSSKS